MAVGEDRVCVAAVLRTGQHVAITTDSSTSVNPMQRARRALHCLVSETIFDTPFVLFQNSLNNKPLRLWRYVFGNIK